MLMALTRKRDQVRASCGGALERGHGAPLEPLAQLGDALGGVGASLSAPEVSGHATDRVVSQTANAKGRSRSVKGR